MVILFDPPVNRSFRL